MPLFAQWRCMQGEDEWHKTNDNIIVSLIINDTYKTGAKTIERRRFQFTLGRLIVQSRIYEEFKSLGSLQTYLPTAATHRRTKSLAVTEVENELH